MSEMPITPAEAQEYPDNVIHANFGRETDPAHFFGYAETSIEGANHPKAGVIDLDAPDEVFSIPVETVRSPEPVRELTRTEQLHLAAKSMNSTDQVAYVSAISRSLPALRAAGQLVSEHVSRSGNWFKKLLVGTSNNVSTALTTRELIEREALLGGSLFDVVPDGHRREFFCLDDHTWVWHEEWIDEAGQRQVTSTRYEVHSSGILKAQNGTVYKFIDGPELENLVVATRLYYEEVAKSIYGIDPMTGQTLPESLEQVAA